MLMKEEKRSRYSWHCGNHRCLECGLCHCLVGAIRSFVPRKDSLFPWQVLREDRVPRISWLLTLPALKCHCLWLSHERWERVFVQLPSRVWKDTLPIIHRVQWKPQTSMQAANRCWSQGIIASCCCLCQISIALFNEMENNSMFTLHSFEDTLKENVLCTLVKCG